MSSRIDQRFRAAGDFHRVLAAAGHEQSIVRARERLAQDVQIGGVVIDQEDPALVRRRHWCRLVHHVRRCRRDSPRRDAAGSACDSRGSCRRAEQFVAQQPGGATVREPRGDSRKPRHQRREYAGRQDRFRDLERGAAQVHVGGVERERGDLHRLALQGKSEQIEDVLTDIPIMASLVSSRPTASRMAACGSASSGCLSVSARSARPQTQRVPHASRTAPGRGHRVRGSMRRTSRQRQPATDGVRRRGIEERIDELSRGARAKRGQASHHLPEYFPVGEQRNDRAGHERVGGHATTRRMRERSPERRLAMAATTGSSWWVVLPSVRPHRRARGVSTRHRGRHACRQREIEARRGLLEVFGLTLESPSSALTYRPAADGPR